MSFIENPALDVKTVTPTPSRTAPSDKANAGPATPSLGTSKADGAVRRCTMCNKKCTGDEGLRMHMKDMHLNCVCPDCKQVFASHSQLVGHQKAANHVYCREHDVAFADRNSLLVHQKHRLHVTGFECTVCDRRFGTQQGLDDHLANKTHPEREVPSNDTEKLANLLEKIEEKNLRCEACSKHFKTLTALRQHRASVKHKPLSELKCPMSDKCVGVFTSPSALIFHLESGGCKSGMNRVKLNAIVHLHDSSRHITYAKNAPGALSAAPSMSSLTSSFDGLSMSARSTKSGVISTLDDSDTVSISSTDNGVLLTPTATSDAASISSFGNGVRLTPSATTSHSRASSISSAGGAMLTPSATTSEWTLITNSLKSKLTPSTTSLADSTTSTIMPDDKGRWPCNSCPRTFTKHRHLLDHLNSPAHAPKLFHCPTAMLGLHATGKHAGKGFKTLSGMAQHIEVGACVGGKGTLDMLVGMFEEKVKAATGMQVKLLK